MEVINRWKSAELAARYRKQYSIDIDPYLASDEITLVREEQTGVLKFHGCRPGEGSFYDSLATWDQYYIEDKWEFDQAVRLILDRDREQTRILDVGCGSGAFLECCQVAGFQNLFGLEFNETAIRVCLKKGLKVIDERIETLAASDKKFDVITAFQVLEHVDDPLSFFQSASKMLSPGGRIIFSTPNADSFLKRFQWNLLDLPPHHASRWDTRAYQTISGLVGLNVDEFHYEPLAPYHYHFYASSFIEHLKPGSIKRKVAKHVNRLKLRLNPNKSAIQGHSILASMSGCSRAVHADA
jgi:2-polyprenyl-3-methyl-5-hydroxy-6-metoxy-1,4-benzoquinol methylase